MVVYSDLLRKLADPFAFFSALTAQPVLAHTRPPFLVSVFLSAGLADCLRVQNPG